MGPFRKAIYFTAAYIAAMAIGMSIMHFGFGYSYEMPEMTRVLWAVEVALTGIAIAAVLSLGGFARNGFGPIRWKQTFWILPLLLIAVIGTVQVLVAAIAGGLSASQWGLLGVIGLTTALVGFSEEVMFRGALLHAALKRFGVKTAMVLSAAAFSSLHAVNVLGGLAPSAMVVQLVLTFVVGLLLAPIALRIGNLWPLIIWHALWDFALVAGSALGVQTPLAGLALPIELVLIAILWWQTRAIPLPSDAGHAG
ncbi:hypothetical protein SAMN04488030_3355 [Aliiroseovarius halocynthiae]|uniref:CPBP family intramembrane metalloprotease n=1 Tax=Aliiroseovarius halocynthiae TaxID=985055 RepID=A0A545SLU7_9RHOB|nr:CPBP family intramembrane glutamic endopeptidase [Aliiroseovarius halocynthiae]TQV65931.1 CPBP family intramembrane metalloprotease [Aliiroseovarius halocynthiae]SMR83436.1 hypothetical protein SAMN04488030_3355 [Aliiroseovarius halocynthiae]